MIPAPPAAEGERTGECFNAAKVLLGRIGERGCGPRTACGGGRTHRVECFNAVKVLLGRAGERGCDSRIACGGGRTHGGNVPMKQKCCLGVQVRGAVIHSPPAAEGERTGNVSMLACG